MKDAPIFRELGSLKDLARLSCAFERIPRPLFAMPVGSGKFALAVHAEQLGDSPVFFYTIVDSFKPYLRYRLDGDLEEASFVDDATLAQYLHSPVLTLKVTPQSFAEAIDADGEADSDVERVELGDVNSLLKLGAYRYIMDESYAPLYLTKAGDELHLGTFVHMGTSRDRTSTSTSSSRRTRPSPSSGSTPPRPTIGSSQRRPPSMASTTRRWSG